MQETKRLYNELKDELNTRLIHEETYSFQKGILLLPTSLAKGIELDVVIIPDASNEAYGKERDQTIFYTSCTRAMHQVIMLSEGEESRFNAEDSRDKYERIG